MMTYAELYGNIKKRPLKCDLQNKMTLDVSDSLSSVTKSLENTLGIGDTLENMTKDIDVKTLSETVLGSDSRLQGI